jgi:hypothetical protein
MKTLSLLLLLLIPCLAFQPIQPQNGEVIQFDITHVLNARPVTTLTNGKLITWTKGIDGGGKGDGYLTRSAAFFDKQDSAHALPDNALFPANDQHPTIRLHYSNRDSLYRQTCSMSGEDAVEFVVPKAKYKALFFALTSAEGASALSVTLTYFKGDEVKLVSVPDYYADIPAETTNLCYLAHNLAKWGPTNQMTEKGHHNIDLLKIAADPSKVLTKIRISKEEKGYVVFWAAAGEE